MLQAAAAPQAEIDTHRQRPTTLDGGRDANGGGGAQGTADGAQAAAAAAQGAID